MNEKFFQALSMKNIRIQKTLPTAKRYVSFSYFVQFRELQLELQLASKKYLFRNFFYFSHYVIRDNWMRQRKTPEQFLNLLSARQPLLKKQKLLSIVIIGSWSGVAVQIFAWKVDKPLQSKPSSNRTKTKQDQTMCRTYGNL